MTTWLGASTMPCDCSSERTVIDVTEKVVVVPFAVSSTTVTVCLVIASTSNPSSGMARERSADSA